MQSRSAGEIREPSMPTGTSKRFGAIGFIGPGVVVVEPHPPHNALQRRAALDILVVPLLAAIRETEGEPVTETKPRPSTGLVSGELRSNEQTSARPFTTTGGRGTALPQSHRPLPK